MEVFATFGTIKHNVIRTGAMFARYAFLGIISGSLLFLTFPKISKRKSKGDEQLVRILIIAKLQNPNSLGRVEKKHLESSFPDIYF